jgi:predicted transcriptional regulator
MRNAVRRSGNPTDAVGGLFVHCLSSRLSSDHLLTMSMGFSDSSVIDDFPDLFENALYMKTSGFLLRGFRRPREIACFALGKLEQQVLDEVWRFGGEVSVRDVHRAFDERIAYTTLMTTLDRLFKKNLLNRRKDGRAFLYTAAMAREDFDQGIKADVIDGLLGQGADGIEPVLACIVDTVSERDLEFLDELDRLVQEKKRELGRKA